MTIMEIKQPKKMAYQPPVIEVYLCESANVIAGSLTDFEPIEEEPF